MSDRILIRGVTFDSVSLDEAAARCTAWLDGNGPAAVIHTPNAEITQLCVEQPDLRALINSADLILPDGAGVVLAARILKTPLVHGKVAGCDLCERLIEEAAENGRRLFLLGGKPGVAEEAARRMTERFPALTVCGTRDGYFSDDAEAIRAVNDAAPDLLFVCLGAPKQERFMHDHRNELNVRLIGGFGGTLDVWAGSVKRAPKLFIRLNLEWFYRLLCEPRRIGRMMKLPKFILGTVFHKNNV